MNRFLRRALLWPALAIAAVLPVAGRATAGESVARLAQAPVTPPSTIAIGEPNPAAPIALPALFSDGMVLQRDLPIPFWGTAAPGQKVTVTLDKQTASVTADGTGKWLLRLKPLAAGGPYEVTVSGRNTITYKDVLIGDVWIAAGQSNMAFRMAQTKNSAEEIANSEDPSLRTFTVANNANFDVPQSQLAGNWIKASPSTTRNFSAVAYFFGRELRRELNVPIGLIHSSWGGTVAQAWTRREVLTGDPSLRSITDAWDKILAGAPASQAKYDADMKLWQEAADKAKAEGQPEPKKPAPPTNLKYQNRPSGLYNGMIAPLIPYAIKGAIWYQGESNAGQPEQYRRLFPAMITNWRQDWGQGDFPFLFVQLANYTKVQTQPSEGGWALVREAQTATLSLPNTGMAVTTDIGEGPDIHPKNKQDVGKRLALAALAQVYGRKIPYSGPRLDGMTVEGNTLKLRFKHTDGGLKAQGGEELKGFAIAGADKKFVWATAKIVGDTIELCSPEVAAPAAARYNWASNPIGNLHNGAGLPAGPFRTDTW